MGHFSNFKSYINVGKTIINHPKITISRCYKSFPHGLYMIVLITLCFIHNLTALFCGVLGATGATLTGGSGVAAQVRGGASPFDVARRGRLGMPRGTRLHSSRWRRSGAWETIGSRGLNQYFLDRFGTRIGTLYQPISFCCKVSKVGHEQSLYIEVIVNVYEAAASFEWRATQGSMYHSSTGLFMHGNSS